MSITLNSSKGVLISPSLDQSLAQKLVGNGFATVTTPGTSGYDTIQLMNVVLDFVCRNAVIAATPNSLAGPPNGSPAFVFGEASSNFPNADALTDANLYDMMFGTLGSISANLHFQGARHLDPLTSDIAALLASFAADTKARMPVASGVPADIKGTDGAALALPKSKFSSGANADYAGYTSGTFVWNPNSQQYELGVSSIFSDVGAGWPQGYGPNSNNEQRLLLDFSGIVLITGKYYEMMVRGNHLYGAFTNESIWVAADFTQISGDFGAYAGQTPKFYNPDTRSWELVRPVQTSGPPALGTSNPPGVVRAQATFTGYDIRIGSYVNVTVQEIFVDGFEFQYAIVASVPINIINVTQSLVELASDLQAAGCPANFLPVMANTLTNLVAPKPLHPKPSWWPSFLPYPIPALPFTSSFDVVFDMAGYLETQLATQIAIVEEDLQSLLQSVYNNQGIDSYLTNVFKMTPQQVLDNFEMSLGNTALPRVEPVIFQITLDDGTVVNVKYDIPVYKGPLTGDLGVYNPNAGLSNLPIDVTNNPLGRTGWNAANATAFQRMPVPGTVPGGVRFGVMSSPPAGTSWYFGSPPNYNALPMLIKTPGLPSPGPAPSGFFTGQPINELTPDDLLPYVPGDAIDLGVSSSNFSSTTVVGA
jgi:hypothetical protein